jgi:hypothetical protein
MSYTFGGATSNRHYFTLGTGLCPDNGSSFVAGWWYPTTLTAGRAYWGAGATIGAEVDTTTSEIRMRTDNTTDGQWLTSGAAITTNKWWFLAFLAATENTTVAGAWRVWVGDEYSPPVLVTVTNPTVRSGSYTAGTVLCVGNKSGGTLSFQGDIYNMYASVTTAVGLLNGFGINTSGAIDAYGEAQTYREFVLPLWSRQINGVLRPRTAAYTGAYESVYFPLKDNIAYRNSSATTPGGSTTLTLSGTTLSYNEPIVRPLNPKFTVEYSLPRR